MRHRVSGRKLGRTASHRKALLNSLCTALLKHKRIKTTVAKAKETRMVVEKMITRAKHASVAGDGPQNVHARRMVARNIKDKMVVRELFGEIAEKVASRPGGYTRIVRLGRRPGDGAEVALLELVDFQGVLKPGKGEKPGKDEKDAAPKAEKKEKKAQKESGEKKTAAKSAAKTPKKKKESAAAAS